MRASMMALGQPGGQPTRQDAMPPGMRALIAYQFWDILAFQGSRLLLVLYLVDTLLHPAAAAHVWGLTEARDWAGARFGVRSDQMFVSAIFGLFGALANLTPVIGGWLSDRFVSRRGAVIFGAMLMAAGHAMLALQAPFLIGLVLLACGNGFYRGTVSAMLANLFARDDARLPGAFQLSYSATNLAAMTAPLVCGTLGELVGWSWGFGAAAIAMLIGLATFLAIPSTLLAPPSPIAPTPDAASAGTIGSRMTLIAGIALFMIANDQLGNAMVVWLKGSVDRDFGATTIPLTWFFSVTPLAITVATILLARRGTRQGAAGIRRRLVRGCLLGGAGWASLALAATAARVPAIAVILFLCVWGGAFALVLPSGAALMAELTPQRGRGGWLGIYYLVAMLADIFVGALGGLYGHMPHPAFIAAHAAIVVAGGALLATLGRSHRTDRR